jgi:hypothetical protein
VKRPLNPLKGDLTLCKGKILEDVENKTFELKNNMDKVFKTIRDAISPPNRGIRWSQNLNQKPGEGTEV